jgi:hypothetical protein
VRVDVRVYALLLDLCSASSRLRSVSVSRLVLTERIWGVYTKD